MPGKPKPLDDVMMNVLDDGSNCPHLTTHDEAPEALAATKVSGDDKSAYTDDKSADLDTNPAIDGHPSKIFETEGGHPAAEKTPLQTAKTAANMMGDGTGLDAAIIGATASNLGVAPGMGAST